MHLAFSVFTSRLTSLQRNNVCPLVCPSTWNNLTGLLDEFSWNIIFGIFTTFCLSISILVKIAQKLQTLYIKINKHFAMGLYNRVLSARYKRRPKKHLMFYKVSRGNTISHLLRQKYMKYNIFMFMREVQEIRYSQKTK